MKIYKLVLFLCILTTHSFSQPRLGLTGGMNLSVLTGTVNMETNLKLGIMLGKGSRYTGI